LEEGSLGRTQFLTMEHGRPGWVVAVVRRLRLLVLVLAVVTVLVGLAAGGLVVVVTMPSTSSVYYGVEGNR
jgi:hypothetical protein